MTKLVFSRIPRRVLAEVLRFHRFHRAPIERLPSAITKQDNSDQVSSMLDRPLIDGIEISAVSQGNHSWAGDTVTMIYFLSGSCIGQTSLNTSSHRPSKLLSCSFPRFWVVALQNFWHHDDVTPCAPARQCQNSPPLPNSSSSSYLITAGDRRHQSDA